MMRTRQLVIVAMAVALVPPAAASADWGPTQDLGPLAEGARFAYDGNARGDRIAVWETGTGTFLVAQARSGQDLGTPRELPDAQMHFDAGPTVELDESGNALIAWSYFDFTHPPQPRLDDPGCCSGVRFRIVRRDGSYGGVATLAEPGRNVTLADMQIGPRGLVGVVVHNRRDELDPSAFIQGRFGTIATGFGRREEVASGAQGVPTSLAFVRGRARVMYATSTGTTAPRPLVFREVERLRRDRYRRMRSPGNAELSYDSLRFATRPDGEQVATWMRRSPGRPSIQEVYAGSRRPGEPFRFERLAAETAFSHAPLAIEPGGNALTAWSSVRKATVVAASRRPRGDFGAIGPLGPRDTSDRTSAPALDVNAEGDGLLAWAEGVQSESPRLVGVFRTARGSAVERHVIEPRGERFTPFPGTAASLDRRGRGHVAYTAGGRLKVIAFTRR